MGMTRPADIAAFAEIHASEREATIEMHVALYKADPMNIPPLDLLDEVLRRTMSPEEFATMNHLVDADVAALVTLRDAA